MNQFDYLDAGFRIFGLHGVDAKGNCECGNPHCKAILKHPRTSAWQHTPNWSDEQLDTMEMMGQFSTGFGVLVDEHIVIDIDPRNGGSEAYAKLCKDLNLDFKALSGFVVATGGGGWHIYFKKPLAMALAGHHADYEGIDFKSSGYVVGCGSLHKSGSLYEAEKGHPDDIAEAPAELLALLEKPEHIRAEFRGQQVDLSADDLGAMLQCIDANCSYEQWIKIGMALHHATTGTGCAIWDTWSATGEDYAGSEKIGQHWHSFGKSASLVTVGTLVHFAEQGGYQSTVTFETDLVYDEPLSDDNIDLLRPPGFVGKLVEWINGQCRFPRERLAVAAALSAMGNISGLRYEDKVYGVTTNQFIFCVAGSATGKEAIQQAQAEIHKAAGIAPATHGAIKSEQEIIRNLIDHQAACYIIDEMGLVLQKIDNARKRGGAAYLEGVIGALMSAYSKANSFMPLGGDVRKEIKMQLAKELGQLKKRQADGADVEADIASIERQLSTLDSGLERPFLSLIGYTTPVTFNGLVDYEQSANGFFGRSLIIQEKETNPKAKKRFKTLPMDMTMSMTLASIYNGGSVAATGKQRVEHLAERVEIPTEAAALDLLDTIEDEFHAMAEKSKEATLEAIPRRAFELVLKVSLVLAIDDGFRSVEHVRWAYAFVKADIQAKVNLAAGNMAADDRRHDEALHRKILNILDHDGLGESIGVIANRCRPAKKEDVLTSLEILIEKGFVKKDHITALNNKKLEKYFLA